MKNLFGSVKLSSLNRRPYSAQQGSVSISMQCTLVPGVSSPVVADNEHDRVSNSNTANNSDADLSMVELQAHEQKPRVVCVRNLNKSYQRNGESVLKNLCMNVRTGTIYGLLGSSGCGKTTLLSCIVGLKQWDSGDVLVFGKRPGSKESGIPGKRIGYMPQSIALYNQLSILEMIQFYGKIYNMTGREVSKRWAFLSELLQLSSNFKLIGNLSGGQKRRASLALALLHSPQLLVLDEPTVGLDPLLRTSIWNHLRNTVSTLGTTIIITTHYNEEALLSDTIGVMRKGRLLVEQSPSQLLIMYGCERLEQVVLQLCRQDEMRGTNAHESGSVDDSPQVNHVDVVQSQLNDDCRPTRQLNESNKPVGNVKACQKISSSGFFHALRRIYGLTTVLLLTFVRYPAFLAFLLVMPSIQGTITLLAIGPPPKNLGFGIVNHELLTNWTEECGLPRHSGNACDVSLLSCKYINVLKRDNLFALKSYITEDKALGQAHQGKIWGYLTFPHNFTQHTLDRIAAGKYALNESLEGSQINIRLDYSQKIASTFMTKNLMNSYLSYAKQLAESCDLGVELVEIPLSFKKPVYGDNGDDLATFIMPGVILSFLLGVPITLTSIIAVTDRKQGTLSRAVAAGLATSDVIASHMITQGIFVVCQFFIWNGVVHYVFGIPNNGALWIFLIFCLLAALAGTGIGLFIGTICHDEVEAIIAGIFTVPIFLLFGGTFFPLENMSKFWQEVGSIIPTTLATLSVRSVIVRGVGLLHSTVWPGLLVLVAWIVVMPSCSSILMRKFSN